MRLITSLMLLWTAGAFGAPAISFPPGLHPRQQIVLDKVRLAFEPQDRPSEFAAHAPGIEVEMRATGVTLNGRRIQLAGANPAASATAEDALSGRSNYYLGAEPPGTSLFRTLRAYGIATSTRTTDGKSSGGRNCPLSEQSCALSACPPSPEYPGNKSTRTRRITWADIAKKWTRLPRHGLQIG